MDVASEITGQFSPGQRLPRLRTRLQPLTIVILSPSLVFQNLPGFIPRDVARKSQAEIAIQTGIKDNMRQLIHQLPPSFLVQLGDAVGMGHHKSPGALSAHSLARIPTVNCSPVQGVNAAAFEIWKGLVQ